MTSRTFAAVALATLLSAGNVSAASLALAWDASPDSTVTGYVVLIGSASGVTEQTVDVARQTSWTFTTAVPGRTYFFRVQAYTAAGVRSTSSNEVSGMADASTPLAPYGAFDTPLDNSTGLTGSVAVTGWALDDVGVTKVRILRAPVAGEAAGTLVPIGDATLVSGARTDIATLFPAAPGRDRAGWGYLMLTNFLPGQGTGTFTLYAYADDADGHSTLIGTKTITCANVGALTPFGAIDTPTQGQTVSGLVTNYGWVLSPAPRRADPTSGGRVQVFIDAVPVGSPGGWTSRSDLSTYFPVAQYPGINRALGVFTLDTRTLSNGVHTIAWGVTDNANGTAGVGSRYFTVANGLTSVADPMAASATASSAAASGDSGGRGTDPLIGRRGFDLDAPMRTWRASADGRFVVQAEELDRIELHTGATSAALVSAEGLRSLPAGARFDADGMFTWQPGVAFVGTYDFLFGVPGGERHVRVILNPRGSGRVGPQITVDAPSLRAGAATLVAGTAFNVAGWAADLDDQWGTGVDAVHVWALPRDGGSPVFLGHATHGGSRPDVAAVYGERFGTSGFGLTVGGLGPGHYDLAVFAWSTVLGDFAPAATVPVRVR